MLTSGMKTNLTLVQVRPRDHQRYRDIPIFGRFLDDFVPWAFGRGYTRHSNAGNDFFLSRLERACNRAESTMSEFNGCLDEPVEQIVTRTEWFSRPAYPADGQERQPDNGQGGNR